jgi:hypothetical protein
VRKFAPAIRHCASTPFRNAPLAPISPRPTSAQRVTGALNEQSFSALVDAQAAFVEAARRLQKAVVALSNRSGGSGLRRADTACGSRRFTPEALAIRKQPGRLSASEKE